MTGRLPFLGSNGNPRLDIELPEPPRETDPRKLTVEQLNALGHTKQPLLRVIRMNCVECCAGNEAEVRRCGMRWCPFWPYRMGTNPFSERTGNPEALRNVHARRVEARQERDKTPEAPSGVVE